MSVVYMADYEWDLKLNIDTIGRKDSHADDFHHPYEPTPYSVLERLAKSGYILSNNKVVDYGSGKGRVSFFLAHQVGCKSIGVEFDKETYDISIKNLKRFSQNKKVSFYHGLAEEFDVDDGDSFFFFNPFTVEYLRMVISNIMESYHENPRRMRLFFYYPDEDYLDYLHSHPELEFVKEIDCRDLFEDWNNIREVIVVFRVIEYI